MKNLVVAFLLLLASFAGAADLLASGISKPSPVGAKAIGMGGAFVAVADDPTAIYWNPAGLMQLEGTRVTFGFDSTIPGLSYNPYTAADPTGVTTSREHAKTEFYIAPSIFASSDFIDPVVLGIGFYLPYATGGKFSSASQAVLNPLDGRIYTLEISPAVAVRLHRLISIGAGFRLNYIKDKLNGQLIAPIYGAPFAGNFANINTDGWGMGATAGILIGPYKNLRFGVSYRSMMNPKLSGTFTLNDASGATLVTDDIDLELKFPNQVRIGLAYDVNQKLLLATQFDWEQNSQIENFVVTFATPGFGTFALPANYNNSYTWHLGGRYLVNQNWTARMGYTYDDRSVPDAANNRITGDVNAHEIAAGASYDWGRYGIDISYNLRIGGREVPVTTTNQAPGDYFGYVQSVSLMGRVNFD